MKTKRTATKVKSLGPRRWFRGSALYRVDPAVTWNSNGYLTYTSYVIVAITPRTVDTGKREISVFPARANGSLPVYFTLDDIDILSRVFNSNSHRQVLRKLQGGYTITRKRQERPRSVQQPSDKA